jgi:hypothetical protein
VLKTLVKSLLTQLALRWQAERIAGKPSGLQHATPRINLPGEAAQGERFRLDCTTCQHPMTWDGRVFLCSVCAQGLRTQDAALIFIEAGMEMLRAADRLDALDPPTDNAPNGAQDDDVYQDDA